MRLAPTIILAALSSLSASSLAQGTALPPNQQAIADVTAGRLTEARASWWGFDPAEATASLQAAIDSGVPRLIVDNVGMPWTVGKIRLRSKQTIVFEKGTEVIAKKGAFKGVSDSLFVAYQASDLTLMGYGAILRMRRADYAGPEYHKGEWRHVIDLRSCENVRILGLTLADSGGDGIYLGNAGGDTTNKSILIRDVICDRNYRQGISVITAEDLLIESCVLRDTAGTAPAAGIDFEPNAPYERLVRCVMRNCVTQGNAGGGYVISLGRNNRPVFLRFEGCRSVGDANAAVSLGTPNSPEKAVRGAITFRRCRFERTNGCGIVIDGKPAGGARVRFSDCAITGGAQAGPTRPPIAFRAGSDAGNELGGVEFVNLRVEMWGPEPPMTYADMAGGVGVSDITGDLLLEREGSTERVRLSDELVRAWMPAAALTAIPRLTVNVPELAPVSDDPRTPPHALAFARLRKEANLLLYAHKGDAVEFSVQYDQVAHYHGAPMSVTVIAPSGAQVLCEPATFQAETQMRYIAPLDGVYRVQASPGANWMRVVSSSHPMLLSGEEGPVGLYASTGELFFWVPEGTTHFGVRITGEAGAEAVRGELVDPSGRVVEIADNVTATHQFEVNLAQPSPAEAWSLRLLTPTSIMMEDQHIDLRGVPPLWAASPRALLRSAR